MVSGQILALAFRQRSLKSFQVFPLRREAAAGYPNKLAAPPPLLYSARFASSALIRQSRPDFGLGFEAKGFTKF